MNKLFNLFSLLAAVEGDAPAASQPNNSWILYVGLAVVMLGMILLSVIPNRKRQKEYQKMQADIKPGTRIMTIGRMIGKVVRVYEDGTIELDVGTAAAPVVIVINREAVGINLDAQQAQQAALKAAKEKKETPVEDACEIAGEESAVVDEVDDTVDTMLNNEKNEDDAI